jgi:hypothetical protein
MSVFLKLGICLISRSSLQYLCATTYIDYTELPLSWIYEM